MALPKIATLLTSLAAISALGADVEGVVTFHRSPDSYFFLETVSGEVWRVQRDSNDPRVSIGDVVHVGGHRIKGIVTPRFKADVMRKLGHDKSLLPRPERVSIGELLLDPVAVALASMASGHTHQVVAALASMASGHTHQVVAALASMASGR